MDMSNIAETCLCAWSVGRVTFEVDKYPLGLYWGYIGIMEKKMETTIMENQMEKKMDNEMETGIFIVFLSASSRSS